MVSIIMDSTSKGTHNIELLVSQRTMRETNQGFGEATIGFGTTTTNVAKVGLTFTSAS